MNRQYQMCTYCIMDTSDPEIVFNAEGRCHHCLRYETRAQHELFHDAQGQAKLEQLIAQIQRDGRGRPYDCLIGVSGGVDSTYLAYEVKRLGLRPLALHLDNGWNSELAISNIEKVLRTLNVDLHTHVIDWEEFKDLQLSFLKSSVPNCEIPTDHAVVSLFFRMAVKYGIRYIMRGGNLVTEGILPASWGYDAKDFRHIKAIHKRFGKSRLKSYPKTTLVDWVYYTFVKRIKFIPLLNYLPYNKDTAKQLIINELGWRDYGGKHYESIFTRFFQAYFLPNKFGFDKRRAHLSTLICSQQLTRQEALDEMEKEPYATRKAMDEDIDYIMKKFELSRVEFDAIMQQPPKTFRDYPNNYFILNDRNVCTRVAKRVMSEAR